MSTEFEVALFDHEVASDFEKDFKSSTFRSYVVGPASAVIYTDRDHRIKVQLHWQQGAASHSCLNHPAADSHTGAPDDGTAGTWVRVATPLAGANRRSNTRPRVGQEVLADFLEGGSRYAIS